MDAQKLDGRWWRSVLFTAGHWDDLGQRLGATVADMVMLDLEDGVPTERKDDARAAVGRLARESWRPILALRVNTPESGLIERDLDGALGPGIDAVILPKPQTAQHVRALDEAMGRREAALGMPEGAVCTVPLVETCAGALAAAELARASPRVLTLGIGASDFVADIGRPVSRKALDPETLSLARRLLVLAARAAGLGGPFDGGRFPPGEPGWEDACEAVRRIGFQGKVSASTRSRPAGPTPCSRPARARTAPGTDASASGRGSRLNPRRAGAAPAASARAGSGRSAASSG